MCVIQLIKDEREEIQESLEVLKGKEMEEEAEAALQKLSAQAQAQAQTQTQREAKETLTERAGVDKALSESTTSDEEIVINRTLAPGHRGAREDEEAGVQTKTAYAMAAAVSPLTVSAQEHVLAPAMSTSISASPADSTALSAADSMFVTVPKTVTMAGAKPVTPAADDDEAPDLSVYELQQISDLARTSAVQREKVILTQLQVQLEALLSKNLVKKVEDVNGQGTETESGKPGRATVSEYSRRILAKLANKEDDRTINNLAKVLSRMNVNLEHKINTTEKVLGTKLRVLDVDEDGSMSVEELKQGIIKTFKISEEDIDELIEVLDTDKDGKGKKPGTLKSSLSVVNCSTLL